MKVYSIVEQAWIGILYELGRDLVRSPGQFPTQFQSVLDSEVTKMRTSCVDPCLVNVSEHSSSSDIVPKTTFKLPGLCYKGQTQERKKQFLINVALAVVRRGG